MGASWATPRPLIPLDTAQTNANTFLIQEYEKLEWRGMEFGRQPTNALGFRLWVSQIRSTAKDVTQKSEKVIN